MSFHIIASDIGGTSSRFAHFVADAQGHLVREESVWFRTAEANSLDDLLARLRNSSLAQALKQADVFVLAAAGPVEQGVYCAPPNIKWQLDLRQTSIGLPRERIALINDFVATALACVSEIGQEAREILSGERDKTGAIAVIGAGTGLGKAFLLPCAGGYAAGASEGGHVNFSAESAREFAFQQFVLHRTGDDYLTLDVVLSGRGLRYLCEFLTGEVLAPQAVAARFAEEGELVQWASRMYGRACRNFALDTMATNGVYIAGGIAAKNPVLVEHPAFAGAFRCSPTHTRLLQKIPVCLLDNEESGLWGAAYYGCQQLRAGGTASP